MIAKPSFESSVYGRIEQVFLSIPSWVLRYQRQVEIQGTAAVYRSVFASMRKHVRFVVVTQQEGVAHLVEWLSVLGVEGRTEIVTVPNRIKLSVWAEDAFAVCTDESGQRWVLHPADKGSAGQAAAARLVAERRVWKHLDVESSLQSGNILVGDDFWLVGADSASALMAQGILDESKKLHLIASRVPVSGFEDCYESRDFASNGLQWREYCYRGNSESTVQPMFHIDGFLTLAGRGDDGRNQVMVGDPRMAAEALGEEVPEHAMQPAFDDIAAQLEEAGFAVIRNPLPLAYQDNAIARARNWYFASANNALVEVDEGRKTVWLPTYGHGSWRALEKTDRINIDIWQRLGYETRAVGDLHSFAVNLGALRCMTKCMVRSIYRDRRLG